MSILFDNLCHVTDTAPTRERVARGVVLQSTRLNTVMLMTVRKGSGGLTASNGSLVDVLAKSVISHVNSFPHQRRNRRMEVGSKILLAAVLDTNGFDEPAVIADLATLRISPTDIVDYCIRDVAIALGGDWVDDRLSFAEVTVASARLFGLCKAIGQSWNNAHPNLNARALLLVTVGREDHILGPAVLADQLRRRGHSVRLHSNASAASLAEKLQKNAYDAVLVSVATTHSLEKAKGVIQETKKAFPNVHVVLGGAALTLANLRQDTTGADLVTNNIDEALDAMTGNDIDLRVAE